MKPSSGKVRIAVIAALGVAAFAIIAVGALTISHAQLASSPWPMFHHDLRHTGLSQYDTSANSGTEKWAFATVIGGLSSPVIGADGTIYVSDEGYKSGISGTAIGYVYAVKPDGTQKWKFTTVIENLVNFTPSSPAIGTDGTIYVAYADGILYAVKPDGKRKWKFPNTGGAGEIEWSSPTIGTDGTIYLGAGVYLYAINPDGKQKWATQTGGQVESSPAIGADGTIYVGSDGGAVFAVNPDGTQKWAFSTLAGFPGISSPAIGSDGTIYVGSYDYNLYALTDGGQGTVTEKWAFPTGKAGLSSPAIGGDGTIYVGSNEASLYAVNTDGTLKWAFATGSFVESSPAIGADGTIYVGSGNAFLYAVGIPSPTPTPTATATATATPTPVPVTLKVAPTSLKFPKTKVGTPSKPKTVKVFNPKGNKKHPGLPVLIEMVSDNPGLFTETNDCPPTLTADAFCTVSVTFTPNAVATWSGILVITDNAHGSPQTVPLSGKGKK